MRPAFEYIYMNLAKDLSRRSTCKRNQVGCVITSIDYTHVYGVGYNGNAQGLPNTCDRPEEKGNCGCLHAEDNAMLKVSVSTHIPKVLFCTMQPCSYCAKRIINKGGFLKVFYANEYRLRDGINLLETAGIQVIHLKDNDATANP